MAREKGMGNLQQEKSGRWTMRVCINAKRYFEKGGQTYFLKANITGGMDFAPPAMVKWGMSHSRKVDL